MYIISYICFLFIIYSFLGWITEQLYSIYKLHRFQNDGFLNLPLKPMYGFTMASLIALYQIFNINSLLLLLLCFLLPSLVEYISGYLLDHFFNKKYWDYSSLKYNYNGYVCLKFSLYWTILSWIAVIYINPYINHYYIVNTSFINIFTLICLFIIFINLALILKKHLLT